MSAEIYLREYNTSSNSYTVVTNLNLGSTNSANLSASLYPVSAGTNSYEKWLKLNFGGTFTSVYNIVVYKSTGSYVTGETLNFTGQVTTFVTPTNATSSYATTAIPTTEPTSANVSISGTTTNTITSTASTTDFIVIQSAIDYTASAGTTNAKTITLNWDEN